MDEMSSDASLDWKGSWPWGRQSPSKRIADLERRKEEVQRRRKRLEESYLERIVDIERMLEGIEQDVSLARKCEEDRCRRRAKALIEAIERRGVSVPKGLQSGKPDQSLIVELEKLAKSGSLEDDDVELEHSEEVAPGGRVGFEEMAGLARDSARKRN